MEKTIPLLLVVALVATAVSTPVAAAQGGAVSTGAAPSATTDVGQSATADGDTRAVGTTGGGLAAADTSSVAAENESSNTTLTLLQYNDLQTAATNNETYPRMVTLLNRRQAALDNPTVVVGGGDQVSPHSLSPISQWRLPVATLNVVDPAADVVGNHDLDYGFAAVENFSEASSHPWLLANVVESNTGDPIPGTQPTTVVERDGVRIGIVGLADREIRTKTAVDFDEAGYEVRDFSAVGSEYATKLKEERNVDVVIALAHIGVSESETLARNSENIDLIVTGDDEVALEPKSVSGTVIVEAGSRAEYVGEVNLTIQDGEVVDYGGTLRTVTNDIERNETVDRLITEQTSDALEREVGTTETELDASSAANYHDETALGNLIADSFRAQTGADVAVTNAGGIRSGQTYGPGPLTVGDIYSILPFSNTLVTVELTGAELKAFLASQVVTLESPDGRQYGQEAKLQVSGVHYEWYAHDDVAPERQVRDVYVGGEPLDPEATYTVTINSYMRGWDDSVLASAPEVSDSKMLYGTALLEYVQSEGTIRAPQENRLRRVDAVTGERELAVDRRGVTSFTVEAPADAESVDGDSFYVANETGATVPLEDATLNDGEITVTVSDEALAELDDASDSLQVYGKYTSSEYSDDRQYFDRSVVNAKLIVAVSASAGETTTAPPSDTETEPPATESPTDTATPGAEEATGENPIPGFGPVVAVLALALAVLAGRRQG